MTSRVAELQDQVNQSMAVTREASQALSLAEEKMAIIESELESAVGVEGGSVEKEALQANFRALAQDVVQLKAKLGELGEVRPGAGAGAGASKLKFEDESEQSNDEEDGGAEERGEELEEDSSPVSPAPAWANVRRSSDNLSAASPSTHRSTQPSPTRIPRPRTRGRERSPEGGAGEGGGGGPASGGDRRRGGSRGPGGRGRLRPAATPLRSPSPPAAMAKLPR